MTEPSAPPPSGAHGKTYIAGVFGLAIVPMTTVAVPLWALQLDAAPFMIGIALGARAALSVAFSIHGGALMDRIGTRPIMIWCGLAVAILAPLYPFLPWIAAVILLQLAVGFAQGIAWMGAQTRIALLGRADPSVVGRFASITTLGNFVGPLAVGVTWDTAGPVGAFALIGLCGAGVAISAYRLPPDMTAAPEAPVALRDLLPRLRDYAEAFRMTMIQAVGFVAAASCLMTSIYGIRHSFYPVYLESIGFTGTLIGVLMSAGSLSSSAAGLLTGPARRVMPANWALLGAITLAAFGIAATPMFVSLESLLALALFWGIGGGLAFPLTLYVLSRIVAAEQQGISIGIRTTVNRFAGLTTPILMGAIAQATGITASFMVMGGAILICLAGLSFWLLRAPELRVRN